MRETFAARYARKALSRRIRPPLGRLLMRNVALLCSRLVFLCMCSLVACAPSSGTAIAPTPIPQAAGAYRVGYLSPSTAERDQTLPLVVQNLRDLGYVEGQNLFLERKFSAGNDGLLSTLAGELAAEPVNVIVAVGLNPTVAAKAATS